MRLPGSPSCLYSTLPDRKVECAVRLRFCILPTTLAGSALPLRIAGGAADQPRIVAAAFASLDLLQCRPETGPNRRSLRNGEPVVRSKPTSASPGGRISLRRPGRIGPYSSQALSSGLAAG